MIAVFDLSQLILEENVPNCSPGTLGFLPVLCFPFRMLGSMASISFISKLKSLSEKLKASYMQRDNMLETCNVLFPFMNVCFLS